MALVLFVAAAGTAQAEKGASWMVKGKNIENGGTLKPLLQSTTENGEVQLLFTLGGLPGSVLCTTMELVNFKMLGEGTLSEGKIKFSKCRTIFNGKVIEACAPKSKGGLGIVESAPGPALFVLAGGAGVIKFKPAEGEFFTIFETSEECALFENVLVGGELALRDCQGKFKEELVSHLLEADPAASTLKAFGNPATLDGSIQATLAGEHSGLAWSGLPA
jgi:hypothetical protein